MSTTARFALSLDGFSAGPDGLSALPAAWGREHGLPALDGPLSIRAMIDLEAGDRLEVLLVPVLFGDGVPFALEEASQRELRLTGTDTYPDGVVRLTYEFK